MTTKDEALRACWRVDAAQHGRARKAAERAARRIIADYFGNDYAEHRSIDYYANRLEAN